MLDTDIFVAQALRLRLRSQQGLVHLTAHIHTAVAAMHLREALDAGQGTVFEGLGVYAHLFDQLQNEAVLKCQKAVQEMLLLNLLIAVFISQFFALVDCFNRFLCKFLDIHITSFLKCEAFQNLRRNRADDFSDRI